MHNKILWLRINLDCRVFFVNLIYISWKFWCFHLKVTLCFFFADSWAYFWISYNFANRQNGSCSLLKYKLKTNKTCKISFERLARFGKVNSPFELLQFLLWLKYSMFGADIVWFYIAIYFSAIRLHFVIGIETRLKIRHIFGWWQRRRRWQRRNNKFGDNQDKQLYDMIMQTQLWIWYTLLFCMNTFEIQYTHIACHGGAVFFPYNAYVCRPKVYLVSEYGIT